MRSARSALRLSFFALLVFAVLQTGCGPVPQPQNPYTQAPSLLEDFRALRGQARSLRMVGRIDNLVDDHPVRGKLYLFARTPDRLRMELISPFNTPLSVLTVNGNRFALHDLQQRRYLTGPADPCNLERLIRIPMAAENLLQILVGGSPLIDGFQTITWNKKGFYRIEIRNDHQVQRLEIGPFKGELPLLKSQLKDVHGTVFEITYERWYPEDGISLPHEIRIEMPRDGVDLNLRYDPDGVELNIDLPEAAFSQSPPSGTEPEEVVCSD